MSSETAQLVLGLIAGAGFVVWLAGLQFLLTSARTAKSATSLPELTEPPPADWLLGSTEVQGQPATLVKRAATQLVKLGAGTVGTIKILECTDDRLAFERIGPMPGNMSQGNWLRRGELRFTPQGRERTTILYAVERAPLRWLLWLGSLFLLLGLIALIGGYWLLHTLVASSPDLTLRWQTLQMGQIVHFLWPPFLMGGLYRRSVHNLRATFEALTTNLPYTE
jgi:hypothetical protein